jgi:exodeoxyribonuclease VII large subunit
MQSLFDLADAAPSTISELTAQIQRTLESGFAEVSVVGEISSLSRPSSGHLYFNLKDAQACIRAVVWRSSVRRLKVDLENGLEVIARGKVSVYAPRGDYQLILDDVSPKGLGPQDLALRKLKEKLAKLGYFAAERKKSIPRFPRRLALITSSSGAAVRDMLEILARRWPMAEVVIGSVRVQGGDAPFEIARMIALVGRLRAIDVVILGRGGGGKDDLAAFNDERVAHAIFRCPLPIISAVGHEIDVTIADLVADRRALTPSEAIEIATPDGAEFVKYLGGRSQRLIDLMDGRVQSLRQRLDDVSKRRVFREPLERLRERERRLDEIDQRLRRAFSSRLELARAKLAALSGQLDSLSPLNVLARGYSLTRTKEDKRVVRSIADVAVGQDVDILLADGRVSGRIEAISPATSPRDAPLPRYSGGEGRG